METSIPTGDVIPPTLMPSAADQCGVCAATMAPDQRYCVECGERRGGPRAPFMAPPAASAPAAARPRGGSPTASSTVIAGIATLLLAMGVGVLIGHSGKDDSGSSTPAQVITVPSGGGASAAANTAGSAGSAATAAKAAGGSGAAKAATTKSSASGSGSATATPKQVVKPKKGKVVKIGSKGKGPGYQNGKFTGNFFGGG